MKIMKFIIATAAFLMVVSCEQMGLDETKYTYQLSQGTYYNTPEEADLFINGTIHRFRRVYSGNWYTSAEADAEYGYSKGIYNNYGITYRGIQDPTHLSRIGKVYKSIYEIVNNANMGIKGITESEELSNADKKVFIAELRFCRGLAYYNLFRRWGSGPLRTEQNLPEINVPRAGIEETLDFVIADMENARDNCLEVPRKIGTPCVWAAKTILAEAYLWKANYVKDAGNDPKEYYTKAEKELLDVINCGLYSLVQISSLSDWKNLYGPELSTSSEEIFYLKSSRQDGQSWDYLSYTGYNGYKTEDGLPMINGTVYYTHYTDTENTIVKDWDNADLRKKRNIGPCVFGDGKTYGPTTALFTKFRDPYSLAGDEACVDNPVIRYADVLLLYVEARSKKNGAPDASCIECLNQLRRRGYGFDSDTPNSTLDLKLADYPTLEIFNKRFIKEETYEHMNEAKHWFFLVRQGRDVATQYVKDYDRIDGHPIKRIRDARSIREKHWLWPIPENEFNYNKAMSKLKDQNPGYIIDDDE